MRRFFIYPLLLVFVGAVIGEKVPRASIFKIMSNYKKMFGGYVIATGKKAEQEGDEFIFEALPKETAVLKESYNPEKFKPEDLFLNIRIEDKVLMRKMKDVSPGSTLTILIEVREQTVYNKIIPVFVVHDYQVLAEGSGSGGKVKEDMMEFETYEDNKAEEKKPRRRIKIRRKRR